MFIARDIFTTYEEQLKIKIDHYILDFFGSYFRKATRRGGPPER
jgi:hypothetical protein